MTSPRGVRKTARWTQKCHMNAETTTLIDEHREASPQARPRFGGDAVERECFPSAKVGGIISAWVALVVPGWCGIPAGRCSATAVGAPQRAARGRPPLVRRVVDGHVRCPAGSDGIGKWSCRRPTTTA